MGCEFCGSPGGPVLWQNDLCRVVRVDEPDYPGFCRVILTRHAREMTDLEPGERDALMAVVYAVESVVRETMRADKMNLASLGNMTPHLHWHLIPRYRDDQFRVPWRSTNPSAEELTEIRRAIVSGEAS